MPWRLELLRGNAVESPLSEADVVRDADTGGLEDKIFGFGRWRRPASNFYGAVIADFSKIGLVEHEMCLVKASVPAVAHFLVCGMNGASFFNRVLPRTRIALFGANVSIELDWVFPEACVPSGIKDRAFPWSLVLLCEALALL